jgi:flagellar assembly protein FliH
MSSRPALAREPSAAIMPFVYEEADNPGIRPKSDDTANIYEFGNEDKAARQRQQSDWESVREKGRVEGLAQAQAEYENRLRQIRESVVAALRDFARERSQYYKQIEAEVVRLALNIARHILHRESQLDKFLLASLVQVALEQIENRSGVVVHVNSIQAPQWKAYFAQNLEAAYVPEIVEDATLDSESCKIATSLGSAEINIEKQLKEIESGFMDLLAQRPDCHPKENDERT